MTKLLHEKREAEEKVRIQASSNFWNVHTSKLYSQLNVTTPGYTTAAADISIPLNYTLGLAAAANAAGVDDPRKLTRHWTSPHDQPAVVSHR